MFLGDNHTMASIDSMFLIRSSFVAIGLGWLLHGLISEMYFIDICRTILFVFLVVSGSLVIVGIPLKKTPKKSSTRKMTNSRWLY